MGTINDHVTRCNRTSVGGFTQVIRLASVLRPGFPGNLLVWPSSAVIALAEHHSHYLISWVNFQVPRDVISLMSKSIRFVLVDVLGSLLTHTELAAMWRFCITPTPSLY